MTLQIGFLFALLAVMVTLFLTEKLPVDLTAFLGLVILVFGGYLTAGEAFKGFSSPAVITMMSVFILGAALLETGVADMIGGRIYKIVGGSETRLIIVLMLVCGILSAFMNNIAATAVLMPAVSTIARRAGLAPSRLFMPLAFGAILGGTTTLVGTPPNILAAELLKERGLEPFSLFDFTPIGLALLLAGTLYMLTLGRKLLPVHEVHAPSSVVGELTELYQVEERLFSIRLPEDSPLDGQSLAQTRLGNTLGVKVLAIVREGQRTLAPRGEAILRGGDLLMVDGLASDFEELLRLQNLQVEAVRLDDLPVPLRGVGGVRLRIAKGSALVGRSLRALNFRERFGLVVIGMRRGEGLLRTALAERSFAEGDVLLALGQRAQLEAAAQQPDFVAEEFGLSALQELGDQLYWIQVPPDSPLAGLSIRASRLSELAGLTIAGLVRDGETRLAVSPLETLQAGDRLLITAEPSRVLTLAQLGDVRLETAASESPLESPEVGMVEAAIAPHAAVVGKTLAGMEFRDRFGLLVVALWRRGKPRHKDFSNLALRFGDALLLHGPRDRIRRLAAEPDFVVLSQDDQAPRRTKKAPYAFAGLLLMIGLVATGTQPIHMAAFTAASLVILFGAITMPEAYRAIEWKAIFLVAAVLPVGIAMERTGAANLMADHVISVAGPIGNYATLAALVVLASLLSQGLDGAPAVVLLAPVVLRTAEGLGVSPYPMMMGVSLAASAAFMTPFSHKANLLVMGAGGYKSSDYLKAGAPLTLVVFVLLVFLVPIFFPF